MRNQYNIIIGVALLVGVITGCFFDRAYDASLNFNEEKLIDVKDLIAEEDANINKEEFNFEDVVEEPSVDTTAFADDLLPPPPKKEVKHYQFNYEAATLAGITAIGFGLLIIGIKYRKNKSAII